MFCVTYVLSPAQGEYLVHTSAGLKLLGTAFVMCVLGLIFIRKLTTVKV
jgi:Flp pilus assembly protein TadB